MCSDLSSLLELTLLLCLCNPEALYLLLLLPPPVMVDPDREENWFNFFCCWEDLT